MTCLHPRQLWMFDMSSGVCQDCAAKLYPGDRGVVLAVPPEQAPVTLSAEQAKRLYRILDEIYETAHHMYATDTRRRLAREGMGMLPIPPRGT